MSPVRIVATFACLSTLALSLLAQQPQIPPRTWVDKDTGHRVFRLTDEPGSSGFYFNNNAYSRDGRWMVYTAPDGLHTLELATRKTRLLVPNPPVSPEARQNFRGGVRAIVVGHKTNSVFYSNFDAAANATALYKADLDTGAITRLATLPPRVSVATVNADETLGAGSVAENEEAAVRDPRPPDAKVATDANGRIIEQRLVQAADKSQMMERRLAAQIPVVLFIIDLKPGR